MSASMSVPASARNDLHDISIKDCVLIRPYDAVHGVLGEMRIGYAGFLGAADRRDKARLEEVIRDDVAVPMAWPVAVSVDSNSKKLRPMLIKAQFDEILVKIYKHGGEYEACVLYINCDLLRPIGVISFRILAVICLRV
ncbi:hypothetical protein QAD02_003611 [Eretmocerus hayati]|uniref:Uncharacterized protein n=1 Tax=Eretmocerus hayati TaxID=131215 RepID=A0ACC2NMP0_9HYME|nr:hypothetical protein QAD02_003611 [Eretmocerus hayati]